MAAREIKYYAKGLLAVTGLGLGLGFALPLSAQEFIPFTCENLEINITGVPDEVVLDFTIPADNLIKSCTAQNPNELRLVNQTGGIHVVANPNSTQSFPFTVRDALGQERSATAIVTRD